MRGTEVVREEEGGRRESEVVEEREEVGREEDPMVLGCWERVSKEVGVLVVGVGTTRSSRWRGEISTLATDEGVARTGAADVGGGRGEGALAC